MSARSNCITATTTTECATAFVTNLNTPLRRIGGVGDSVHNSAYKTRRFYRYRVATPRMVDNVKTQQARVNIKQAPLDIRERDSNASPLVPVHEPEPTGEGEGFSLHALPTLTYEEAQDSSSLARPGAYAILDELHTVQYVAYTSNVRDSLTMHETLDNARHVRVWPPANHHVHVQRDTLECVLEYWVRELGHWPEGNTIHRQLWEQPQQHGVNPEVAHKRRLYAAVLFAFLAHSVVKQVSYFGGGF